MNLKAIIASLVVGSSSAAMASPSVTLFAHGSIGNTSYGTTVVRNRIDPTLHISGSAANGYDDRYADPAEPCDPPLARPLPQPIAYHEGGVWRGPLPQPIDYREGGVWRGGRRLPPVYRPVVLADGMHFGGDGRTFITVGAQQGRFDTLQISGENGRTFIHQVYVEFDNGQEQVIRNVDRTLAPNQALTLDLDGNRRGIARIVVYGDAQLNGWRRSGGTFTVTAS